MLGVRTDMQGLKSIDRDHSGFRADDRLWMARDGSPRVLFACQTGIEATQDVYPSPWEADQSTGRARRIAASRNDVWNWYADGVGNVRMGIRYDDASGKSALLYRATNADSFRTIARNDPEADASFIVPTTFRIDGTTLLLMHGK